MYILKGNDLILKINLWLPGCEREETLLRRRHYVNLMATKCQHADASCRREFAGSEGDVIGCIFRITPSRDGIFYVDLF